MSTRQFPAFAIRAAQELVGFGAIGDLEVGGIPDQAFASQPQRNRREVEGLGDGAGQEEVAFGGRAALEGFNPGGMAGLRRERPGGAGGGLELAGLAFRNEARVLAPKTGPDLSLIADEHHPLGGQFLIVLLDLRGRRRFHAAVEAKAHPRKLRRFIADAGSDVCFEFMVGIPSDVCHGFKRIRQQFSLWFCLPRRVRARRAG